MTKHLVGADELATYIGVSVGQVDRLTREGVLLHEPRKRESYDLRQNVLLFIRYLRIKLRGTAADELVEKRRDTQRVLCALKELELAKWRGDVISRKAVTATVTTLVTTMKNHVLAVPSRCARLVLGLQTLQEVHEVLDKYVRLALRELSAFDVEQYVKLAAESIPNGQQTRTRKAIRRRSRANTRD